MDVEQVRHLPGASLSFRFHARTIRVTTLTRERWLFAQAFAVVATVLFPLLYQTVAPRMRTNVL
jgi:hypothetical protein